MTLDAETSPERERELVVRWSRQLRTFPAQMVLTWINREVRRTAERASWAVDLKEN